MEVYYAECFNCIQGATVLGCTDCIVYSLKEPIEKLNNFIEEHKNDLFNYKFFINEQYKKYFKKYVNQGLILKSDKIYTPILEKQQFVVILDKKEWETFI